MKPLYILFILFPIFLHGGIKVGADVLFEHAQYRQLIENKKIGLITHQSAVNQSLETTFDLLKKNEGRYKLVAVFAPEHGFYGDAYANESVEDRLLKNVPLYSLFGKQRRPTKEMLKNIDLLVFDLQDIGSRSYTYISTLFYCIEEAAAQKIPMLVLDRPNPMGGIVVDGPLIEEKWRSFLGYIKMPYCHGMTVGELAQFFNEEYKIGCRLHVVPMEGWKREMTFKETGLPWVPTSPNIPEGDTPFFYPTTGVLGEINMVNIGIGYTLPFKLIGAPWIDAEAFARSLNHQKLPGVIFQPYFFRPFFGRFARQSCQGVRIVIIDPHKFLPFTTQYTILGVLKNLYPKQFRDAFKDLAADKNKRETFCKLNGSEEPFQILAKDSYVIWKLRELCQKGKNEFCSIRSKYLIY